MSINNECATNKLIDAINSHYANIWLNKYNTLTTCNTLTYISDEELIAEIKRRKIPISKLTQPEYNWKHHHLVTNNLRYLI